MIFYAYREVFRKKIPVKAARKAVAMPCVLALVVCALTGVAAAGPGENDDAGGLLMSPAGDEREINAQGVLLLKKNKFREAERCFLLAIEKNPRNKYYYNNLAVAYINQGNYGDARRRLSSALELDPAYAKALANMAVSSFYQLKFSEAYSYYLRARAADGAYAKQRFDAAKALPRLEKLSRENPENRDYRRILEYVRIYGLAAP